MRKVISYLYQSLDGVTERPDLWVVDRGDPEVTEHLRELISTQDTVLLGRTTYEEWAPYWPTATHEPFASFINATPKYVASTTLSGLDWANSTLITGNVAAEVARLKAEPGRDIGIHGSATLVRSLLRENLVDELRLAVPPTFAGGGHRLFEGEPLGLAHRTRLLSATPTSTGALLLALAPQPA